MLYRVIYVSSARALFDAPGIEAMLASARRRNAAEGITGILLYHDGGFLQVLEGEQGPVEGLCANIALDPRHQGMIVLWQGAVEKRLFSDWDMGFVPPEDWPFAVGQGVSLLGLTRSAAPWSRDRIAGPLIRRFLRSYRDISG